MKMTAELKFKAFIKRTGLEEKPFQSECFQWCLERERASASVSSTSASANVSSSSTGGILALEMGLGKTIIMLALIECHFKFHTLIVVPLSLLNQWEEIIKKIFHHQPLVYHGTHPKNLKLSLQDIRDNWPIVLTTYGQIALPSDKQANKIKGGKKKSLLHEIQWDRLICDEGHHVSHKNTNEFKGIQALQKHICWLVTGTPIQNSEKELFTLLGLLGLQATSHYYKDSENYEDAVKTWVYHQTKVGAQIILPPLHEHMEIVQWANESERHFSSHIHSLLSFCNVPREAIAQTIALAEDPRSIRMKYLTKARQVCIYPPILRESMRYYAAVAEHKTMEGIEIKGAVIEGTPIDFTELYVSKSKIKAVVQTLLARKDNGCGKIVFCHYYAEIDAIEKYLNEESVSSPLKSLKIIKFDGRVPHSQRHAALNEPADILLAQIKMCREGLNLQEHYSEVYFPSPDFNPAMEDQAIARCWRIGQTQPVHVFRYMMVEPIAQQQVPAYSMDSYSVHLQRKKRKLINKMEEAAMS